MSNKKVRFDEQIEWLEIHYKIQLGVVDNHST
jgi:hypothetical protein